MYYVEYYSTHGRIISRCNLLAKGMIGALRAMKKERPDGAVVGKLYVGNKLMHNVDLGS